MEQEILQYIDTRNMPRILKNQQISKKTESYFTIPTNELQKSYLGR